MPRLSPQGLAGLLFFALLWPGALHGSNAPASGPKRVLILHSFSQQFEPFYRTATAFRTELALQSPDPIEFHDIALESSTLTEGEGDPALADYVRALCRDRPLDLVVPIGAPAFQFCVRRHDQLFPNVPVLASGIEQRFLEGVPLGNRITAVGISVDLMGFLEDIRHVLPATAHISVICGSSPLERYWAAEMQEAWRPFQDRIAFTWLDSLTLAEMRQRVASMSSHSVIVVGLLNVDAAGVPYEQNRALESLGQVATAPIFGFFQPELGHGVLGGRMIDIQELGVESARVAVRILGGESPAAIPPRVSALPKPMFDGRELKRWGIREAQLPPGSQVFFREPGLWQVYKWRILLLVGFCLIEAILILLLLRNRARLRAARAELLRNDQTMRLAAQAARLGVWTLDIPENRLWITDEGRELFGWGPSEPLTLESFIATLRPEDREPTRQGLERILEGGGEFEAEHRIPLAGGEERWIATRGRAEFDREHRPVSVRGVSMDVTTRKQAVVEAQELRRELSHTGRVSLLGQFTASLAHELGQPLGAILRNADAAELFMKRADPDLDEVGAILSDIRRDGDRAAGVIERLRAMLKRQSIEMQPLAWGDLVEDVMRIVRGDANARGVWLEIDTPPDLPPVRGDRVHLQQVLLNLVANAMDALEGNETGDRRVTVRSCSRSDGNLECAVADTGVGIAPDRLAGIFDPFVTSKPNGMGMGLPICRTIIEAHGGHLWAENNPAHGATFRFTIPTC
jgi:PAS domain S-box-containing protein